MGSDCEEPPFLHSTCNVAEDITPSSGAQPVPSLGGEGDESGVANFIKTLLHRVCAFFTLSKHFARLPSEGLCRIDTVVGSIFEEDCFSR